MKPKSTVSIVSANWTRFANAVLLAGSVICNSAFLYFFYNYGWTRHWQFSSYVMGPLSRYALPVFLGVAFSEAGNRVAADQVLTSILLKSKPLSDITNAETVGGTPPAVPVSGDH